jgi:outer membrane lipoprotein-sorting protein
MDSFLDKLDAIVFTGIVCFITFGGLFFAGQVQQSHRDAAEQVAQSNAKAETVRQTLQAIVDAK